METTRIRKSHRGRLYLDEWFAYRRVGDREVAQRLDRDRTTIWKWRSEPSRLDPGKIAALASALDCEPQDLWGPPPARPSLDAMVRAAGADDDKYGDILELVKRMLKRA